MTSRTLKGLTPPFVRWSGLARKLDPPADEKLLHAAFDATMSCWLSFALILRSDKKLKISNGRYKKAAKIPAELKYRYFTYGQLESIYFLVLLDFLSAPGKDRLLRFQDFIEAVKTKKPTGDLRAIFIEMSYLCANGGGHAFQKKIYRCRNFLIEYGFSHIRVDLIIGQIRLCPITRDFDPSAALYMSQQPQTDIVSQKEEQRWIEKFGRKDRGFYEIAIDKRVDEFHKNISTDFRPQPIVISKMVNVAAPKYGIIVLPSNLSTLMMADGFSAFLNYQD